MRQWKLFVKNDENWKVFGACKALKQCLKQYSEALEQYKIEQKKDDDEESGLGASFKCDQLKTRVQYLFNFIMNYRSRFAHQNKTKKTKFLLEEHQ